MRYPVTSRIGYFMVLKNMSETPCNISIVTHGPLLQVGGHGKKG